MITKCLVIWEVGPDQALCASSFISLTAVVDPLTHLHVCHELQTEPGDFDISV